MEKKSLDEKQIMDTLTAFQVEDLNTKGGNVWAYVYDSGLDEVESIAMRAYEMFKNHNGLDFSVFPSLLKIENQIVGEMIKLFAPDDNDIAGSFTSGGTESILLAVKTARDYALSHREDIGAPEILLPVTAHAAFHKAAHYFGLKLKLLEVDDDFKVDPKLVEANINKNTVLIVASSVNYSHGVSDPIEAIGQIALAHDVLFHVDACIGGFVLAYYKKIGVDVQPFDFHLPGVTSLSVDLHKYAFAPKGASVILYKNSALRAYQFFTCTSYTGYPVVNTTVQSTKSGGPLAACWATLQAIGEDGYIKLIQSILDTKNKMVEKLKSYQSLTLLGDAESSLITFTSDSLDVFQLADEMRKRKWFIQIQPGNENFCPTIHLTVTPVSANIIDDFFDVLDTCIQVCQTHPREPFSKEMLAQLDTSEGFTEDSLKILLKSAGVSEDGQLPNEMATINELLHLLPSDITAQAFLYLTNELFTAEIE